MKKQITIARGHPVNEGADGWGKINETDYNRRVAHLLEQTLTERGWDVYNHNHTVSGYTSRINEWIDEAYRNTRGMLAMVELHCNAYDGSARGHEFLYNASPNFARSFADHFQRAFPNSVARGEKGIRQRSSGDGSYFLRKSPVPAVIAEPFFIDNASEYTFFTQPQNVDKYVKALADAIEEYFGVSDQETTPPPTQSLENRVAELEQRMSALENALEKRF